MHSVIHGGLIAVLMLSGVADPGVAQEENPANSLVGQRVRVSRCGDRGCAQLTGVLLESGFDRLTIGVTADSVAAVPRGAVQRIEQSLGRHGHPVRGALVGAGVGLAVGLVGFAAYTSQSNVRCTEDLDCGAWVVIAGGGGAVAGGLIGLGIGALWRTERWADVSAERLSVVPFVARDRTGVALRVPF